MTIPKSSKMNKSRGKRHYNGKAAVEGMNAMRGENFNQLMPPQAKADILSVLSFMEDLGDELENSSDLFASTPNLRISMHLIRSHLEGRLTTMTSLIGASRAPYATANRRIKDMQEAGLAAMHKGHALFSRRG